MALTLNAKSSLLSQPSTFVAAAQLITTSGFKSFILFLTCSKLVISNSFTSNAII